ncbi:hypothetical protein [Proteiniphilum sp. X52]|nr:hypothetical protein [Proteiniphilum sp. X52]
MKIITTREIVRETKKYFELAEKERNIEHIDKALTGQTKRLSEEE